MSLYTDRSLTSLVALFMEAIMIVSDLVPLSSAPSRESTPNSAMFVKPVIALLFATVSSILSFICSSLRSTFPTLSTFIFPKSCHSMNTRPSSIAISIMKITIARLWLLLLLAARALLPRSSVLISAIAFPPQAVTRYFSLSHISETISSAGQGGANKRFC